MAFTFPVLHDKDGAVALAYAPEGAPPDLPKDEVAIAANLIIDKQGKIQFFDLLDSRNFDAKLTRLLARLDVVTGKQPPIVTVKAPLAQLAAGSSGEVIVSVEVAEGFHVQANPAADEFLIPLSLEFETPEGVSVGDPRYPKPEKHTLTGSEQVLLTYHGKIDVPLQLKVSADVGQGPQTLNGTMRYQACDRRTCRSPQSVKFTLGLRVTAGRTR